MKTEKVPSFKPDIKIMVYKYRKWKNAAKYLKKLGWLDRIKRVTCVVKITYIIS